MLRFLLRVVGFALLTSAFALLVVDGSRSIAGGRLLASTLGDSAAWLGGIHYGAALGGVAGWPGPARLAVAGLLALPGALVTGALGLLALHAGRPAVAGTGFSGRRT